MLDQTLRSVTPKRFPCYLYTVCSAESSEEDDWPEDRRAEMQQNPADTRSSDPQCSEPQAQSKAEITAEHRGDDSCQMSSSARISGGQLRSKTTRSTRPPDFAAAVQAAAASLKDSEGPRGEARTAALLLAHAGHHSSDSDTDESDDGHDRSRPSAAPCVLIPAEEQVNRMLFLCSRLLMWPGRFSQQRLQKTDTSLWCNLFVNNSGFILLYLTQKGLSSVTCWSNCFAG